MKYFEVYQKLKCLGYYFFFYAFKFEAMSGVMLMVGKGHRNKNGICNFFFVRAQVSMQTTSWGGAGQSSSQVGSRR